MYIDEYFIQIIVYLQIMKF